MTIFAERAGRVRLDETLVETHRLEVGERTRRLRPSAPRRPWSGGVAHPTGEQPIWPTGAEAATGFFMPPNPGSPPPMPPQPPPVPIPGPPVADAPTERLTLPARPKYWHPRHRACRCLPTPVVAVLSLGTGMGGAALVVAPALWWAVAR